MRKVFSVAFIFVLIVSLLTSCSGGLSEGKVYVYSAEEGDARFQFNVREQYVPSSTRQRLDEPIDKTDKTVKLGEDEIVLTYESRHTTSERNYAWIIYKNKELSMSVSYRQGTDELDSISFGDYRVRASEGITSEEKLLSACEKVAAFFIGGRANYRTSVKTIVVTYGDSYYSSDSYQGYHDASLYPDSEVSYYVWYQYYLGEYATGDLVLISIDSDGYLDFISRQMTGEFDNVEISSGEMSRYDKRIDEEIAFMCDVDGYELRAYEKEAELIYMDDTLCIQYSVSPQIISSDTGEPIKIYGLELLIPLE